MKSPVRYKILRSLTILAFIMAVCAIAVAENGVQYSKKSEVLTAFEQRMQKTISVDFVDTLIDDAVRMMAEQADVDIIKSPNVTGNVTAKLTDVPLEEALNSILAAHGYDYIVTKNVIRIAPAAELAEKPEKFVSRIYRINYADVTEVEKALKKFISKHASLSSNSGTSNIIVTDTESKIKAIDTFIKEIDRITPQILVEARIYDITSKDRLDLGVEWQGGKNTTYYAAGDGAELNYGAASGITTPGTNPASGSTHNAIEPFITGIFTGATGKTSGMSGALRLGWLNNSLDIDAVLKAQQQNINAKLLANPRVLVLDNETAEIKIISEIPYQELTESASGGTMGTTEFREVGVTLKVTPHLTRDEMIRLQLKPEFSVKTEYVRLGTGTSELFDQPVIDRREATTTLLIKSGQTVVLGGLRKKEVAQQINKIPLLGDIPLLGALFKFEGEDTVTSELVVFVTPWIIESPVMSETELKQFEVTEFKGPKVTLTKAEKKAEKAMEEQANE